MKTYTFVALIAVLVCGIWYITTPKNVVSVGAVLSLSGSSSSFYGEYNKNALELLVREVNQSGGINGKKLKVVYEDSGGDKVKGVQAFNKLIHGGTQYVISDVSPVSVGIAPIAESSKTILIATSASNPTLSDMGPYVFRTKMAAQHEGAVAAQYLKNVIRPKSIAFLYQNSDYGVGVFNAFTKELRGSIPVVSEQKFEKGAVDIRTQITEIMSTKPELVIVAGFPKEVGQVLRQSGELKSGLKFFAHSGSIGPDIEAVAGEYSAGLRYLTELNRNTDEFKQFNVKYKLLYGVEPEVFAANAYDALSLIVNALRICGEDTVCVQQDIANTKGYRGVSGNITFDSNGDVTGRGLSCMEVLKNDTGVEHISCGI